MTFPPEWYSVLERPGTVLLESARISAENCHSYVFTEPMETAVANSAGEVEGIFVFTERQLAAGRYVAGYIAYEAGHAMEHIGEPPPSEMPLAWMAAYEQPFIFDHLAGRIDREPWWTPQAKRSMGAISDPELQIARAPYCEVVERVREYIAAGDIYQLNFTDRFAFRYPGEAAELYAGLRAAQRVPYAAFLNLGNTSILSFSPELFFRVQGNRITTRPMKGTAARGRWAAEDRGVAAWLQHDAKNRAENVMIVDLVRNDLGRICEFGSVQVEKLFAVERYETVWQMTSTVSGTLREGMGPREIFRALFPCGSVTGAPKLRAMQILRELEGRARGVYTGAIGYFAPDGSGVFNVPIRTAVVRSGYGEMGVGSGIVWDSDPAGEYEECRLKAKFLRGAPEPFALIESMLWRDGCELLEMHLDRVTGSADYFEFACEREWLRREIESYAAKLPPGEAFKVKLLLVREGEALLSTEKAAPQAQIVRLAMAGQRVCSSDLFLFHKTTRRTLYEDELTRARERGCEDAVFVNERGEVTECAIYNIFAEIGGQLCTPPVEGGLLPGVYRRYVLESNPKAVERKLSPEDLRRAEALYVCNAVRGWQRAELIE